MSGFLGPKTVAKTEPALGGLRIQTAVKGLTIPVVFGRTRLVPNLLWYGDFKAIQHEDRVDAGKGGGAPTRTYYTYTASVVMGLCEGPVGAVRRAWIGKEKWDGSSATEREITAAPEAFTLNATPSPVTVAQAADYARTIAVVIPGNGWDVLDQDLVEGRDFTRSGGTFTFGAAFAGQLVRISYAYVLRSDAQSVMARLGLAIKPGEIAQSIWPYLSSAHSSDGGDIAYSGIAYVYGQDYSIDDQANVPNHSFEIDAFRQFSATIPDANPADIVAEVLGSARYGVSFPSAHLASLTPWRDYCTAAGLFASPAYTQQRAARDVIGELVEACNADPVWTGDQLKIVPRGDQSLTANGVTYTPSNTPVFALTVDDLGTRRPLEIERPDMADCHNRVTVQYADRNSDYNFSAVTVDDEASIAVAGLRAEDAQNWSFFVDPAVANSAARIRLQRKQSARCTYRFPVGWRQAILLQPGDLVTLTEPSIGVSGELVRVLSIEEAVDNSAMCEAEQFPVGHAAAPLVAPQLSSGFNPDFNADPGAITAPTFIEPPGGLTDTGLEVWVALSGAGALWGGANIWVSLDGGTTYRKVGKIVRGARYGTLSASAAAGTGATIAVTELGRGGVLYNASTTERDTQQSLVYVGTPAAGEFLGYTTATLTATNAYSLTGLARGFNGTADQAHASGEPWVLVDAALGKSGPLSRSMVGKTLYFKFTSFNAFNAGEQDLASVAAYSYTIQGRFIDQLGVPVTDANLGAGKGINALYNTRFANDSLGWSVWADSPNGNMTDGQNLNSSWTLLNEGTLWSRDVGGVGGTTGRHGWQHPGVPCIPGQRWEASAYTGAHRCAVGINLTFSNAAGYYCGEITLSGASGTNNNEAQGGSTLSGYKRIGGFFTIPDAAGVAALGVTPPDGDRNIAIVWFRIFKNPTASPYSDSYLFFSRPYMGLATAQQTDLSPWVDGPPRYGSTQFLAANAATQVLIHAPSDGSAGTYNNTTTALSPCANISLVAPVACEALITASASTAFSVAPAASVAGDTGITRAFAIIKQDSTVHGGGAPFASQQGTAWQYNEYASGAGGANAYTARGQVSVSVRVSLSAGQSTSFQLYLTTNYWNGAYYLPVTFSSMQFRVELIKR